jgi:leader peptidase (prepilin peptidase)/N-methyltransferase
MEAVAAVGCALVGLVVGWMLDPVITRAPQPAWGPPEAPADQPSRTRRIVVTIVTGALFGAMGARFDDSWTLPAYLVLTAGLIALAAVDLETFLLPNRLVYPLTFTFLALLALGSLLDDDLDAFGRGLIVAAIAFVFFFMMNLVAPRAMGFGDVRLSFTLGLSLGVLGWGVAFVGFFFSFLFGAVIGIALMAFGLRGRKDPLPFGPFLVAGTLTAILVGDAIITWYTGG